jgi:hypothetical protein
MNVDVTVAYGDYPVCVWVHVCAYVCACVCVLKII